MKLFMKKHFRIAYQFNLFYNWYLVGSDFYFYNNTVTFTLKILRNSIWREMHLVLFLNLLHLENLTG